MMVGTAGSGPMVGMPVAVPMRGMIAVMCGEARLQVVGKPRCCAAQREGRTGRDHAEQIEQGDEPPRPDPAMSGQPDEHRAEDSG